MDAGSGRREDANHTAVRVGSHDGKMAGRRTNRAARPPKEPTMAVDYFLKLDGIEGECQEKNFAKQIQLLSWSWGASNVSSVTANGGSGAGKVKLDDFSISTYFDKATPKFYGSICAGTHIKSGTMTAVKAGAEGKPYLKILFSEVFIIGIQMNGASEVPTVNLSFSYAVFEIDYGLQDETGNVRSIGAVTYALRENRLR
jgi:type VI secretion system secreted protein Hcp